MGVSYPITTRIMIKQLIRQFHFTKAERHGATALALLTGITLLTPDIYRFFKPAGQTDFTKFSDRIRNFEPAAPAENSGSTDAGTAVLFPFDPNSASVTELIRLGVPEKVARTIAKYRDRGGRFRTADDLQKIYTLPEEVYERLRPYVRIGQPASGKKQAVHQVEKSVLQAPEQFPFDPNTASEQDLLRLGLPGALVKRLLHYREKGGAFFQKSDFRKLYGLTDIDYARLEPFISIASAAVAPRPASYAVGHSTFAAPTTLDINGATAEEWQRLPGIGAGRAQKILRFREKLGGFVSVQQVGETFGLPDSVFQPIANRLAMHTPVYRKIDLNSVTEDELNRHPYFNFKQAKLIIAYREQHGPYTAVSDLERIAAFADKAWLERVKPYLMVK